MFNRRSHRPEVRFAPTPATRSSPGRFALPAAALCGVLAAIGPGAAAAIECSPQILIVMDRSGSQMMPLPGGTALKWDIAAAAINGFVSKYEDSIRFGIAFFPGPKEHCDPGAGTDKNDTLVLAPAKGQAKAIADLLAGHAPEETGATPTATTLQGLKGYAPLLDPKYQNYVLLFTDGLPNCKDSEATGEMSIAAISSLAADGIKTFVLGFGLGPDPAAPDGGTPCTLPGIPPGCTPAESSYHEKVLNDFASAGLTARDMPPARTKYYAADDPKELAVALDDIGGRASSGTTVGEQCVPKGGRGGADGGGAGGSAGSDGGNRNGDRGGNGEGGPPGATHPTPGCGCRTAGDGSPSYALLALASLPLLPANRRRKRCRRSAR